MMKHLLLLLFLVGLVNINAAQIYKISSYNGQTIPSCKGQIVSSKYVTQANNGYNNNEDYTVTFCSGSGTQLRLNFSYIDTEAGVDKLYIYDGPNTASTLIATISGNVRKVFYTSTGTCLTIRFKSNGSNNTGLGFLGFFGCPPVACGTSPLASDDCSTAPPICDLNGYCGTTSGWYTADHISIDNDHDKIFCGGIENNSWLSFIASGTTASFNITTSNCSDPSNGIQAMITSTNCTTFTSKACELNGIGTFSLSATGLTIGQKYYIMVDGYAGNDCDYTIQAISGIQTVSVGPVGVVNTICPGQSLSLKATVTGAVGTPTYTWSPAPVSGQGTNTAIYAASATTYTCTVSGVCGGILATYTPKISSPPTVSIAGSGSICSGGAGTTLTATGVLGTPVITFNNNNTSSIPDNNTTGITSNIVVSGISGTVASQLTSVCINISHGNDADLDIFLKSPNGTIIDLSSDNGGTGDNYSNTCFSTSGPSITTGTAPFTGSFTPEQALSLISASMANGTWSLIVKDDSPTDVGLLTGWSLNFQNDITYSWSPSTGLSTTTGAVVTATPTSTTTYTVTAADKGGCSGTATSTVTVVTTPAAPGVTSPVKYCTGATAVALTATGVNLLWYTASTGGAGSATAPTPSTLSAGTTNYYVSQTTGSCEGPRVLIAVQVSTTPSAPTVTTPVTYCQNVSSVALTATGSNLLWYTVSTGGTGSSTAPTPATATVGTIKYYVSQTTSSCESARALIDVIVNTTPLALTVANINYCKDAVSIPLTATGSNLLWYTVATGGAGSVTAPTPSTAVVGTKNYYVSQTTGSCEGPRATIKVTINPKSDASFTYSNSTFCKTGTNPSPTITGIAGGTFTAPAGLTINASTGLITLSTSTLGTYTVTYQVVGTCPNSYTFDVTITNSPNANFSYASSSYCQYSTNPAPIFSLGASSGTFSATPVGLVFVNSSTGVIDLTASTPGITYTITNTIAAGGGCSASTSSPFTVTINPSPTITSSNTATVCSGLRLNIILSSVVPASYSWVADPSSYVTGESTSSVSGGIINDSLINTTNVPQVVVYTVTASTSASCLNLPPHSVSVTVNPAPHLTTAQSAVICTGVPLAIELNSNLNSNHSWHAINSVNVTGESTSAQTTDSIKDLLVNTNTVSEKVIYLIQSQTVSGGCFNTSPDSIVVTVNPAFVLTNGSTSTVCSGTPLSIALSSTGSATYSWLATANNLNVTGESLTLQASNIINNTLVNTSNSNQLVNYAVTVTTLDNCVSPSKIIGVTVYPAPSLTNANTVTVCSGTPLNIVLAANVSSTYKWSASNNTNTTGETTSIQSTGVINDIIFNKTNSSQEITYTINLLSNIGSCLSGVQIIKVTVNPEPTSLNANTEEVCSGVPLTIGLNSSINSTYSWHAINNVNVTGETTIVQTTDNIKDILVQTNTVPEKVIYIVQSQSVSGGCYNTTADSIAVTVNTSPKINNSNTAVTCSGVPLNIVLSSNISATYSWIAADNVNVTGESTGSVGSGVINDSLVNTTNVPQIVIYTVMASTSSSCTNLLAYTISVTVNPAPHLTTALSTVVCTGVPLKIGLNSSISSTHSWHAINNVNVTGESTSIQTTDSIKDVLVNTSTLSEKVIYILKSKSVSGGCYNTSPDSIEVTVNPKSNASFTYANATFCITGTNPSATITGITGGIFTAPAGLIIDANTGLITLSTSTLGTYTVTYQVGGICPNNSTFDVTLTNSPNANFSYASSSYCQYRANPAPIFSVGGSGGTFSASPAGLVFVNSGTGVIDLTASTPGITYTIINTIAAGGGCSAAASSPFTVTINASPTITNSNTANVCSGVRLNIILSSNIFANYNWIAADNVNVTGESTGSVGSGVINDSLTNTTNVPQVVVYTVAASTSLSCTSLLGFTISVTVNPAPHLTTAPSGVVCTGVPLTIGLNSSINSTYNWHAINNVNVTGESTSNQTTDSIKDVLIHTSIASEKIIYILQSKSVSGGCYNTRPDSIIVTVIPSLKINNSNTTVTCSGVPLNIVLSSNIPSTYNWVAVDNINVTGESTSAVTGGVINDNLINTTNIPQLVVYTIMASSGTSCMNLLGDTINVTVNPAPHLITLQTTVVCSGVPLRIGLNSSISATYNWHAIDNVNVTGENLSSQNTDSIKDVLINSNAVSEKVIYLVQSKSISGGCYNITPDSIVVTVNPLPKMNSSNTAVTCSGAPLNIVLSSNLSATYSWVAISNVNVTGETITPSTTTIIKDTLINKTTTSEIVYYSLMLTATGNNCSSSSETIAVTVNPGPVISNVKNATICSGESLNITLNSTSNATYSWKATDNVHTTGESYTSIKTTAVINDVIVNKSIIPQLVVYTVNVQLGSCKSNTPQIIIATINPTPVADTVSLVMNSSDCGIKSGAIIGITLLSGMSPLKFVWKNSGGDIIDSTLNLSNVGAGTYILKIIDANGCYAKVGAGKTLTIVDKNKVVAAFTPSPTSGEIPLLVTFTNNSVGANHYTWNFDAGTSALKDPTYLYDRIGKFNVCLIADNNGNCADTICKVIEAYINFIFVIPNVFTPNGDGVNDLFTISGKGIESLHADIYNRWGQKEYEWNTINGGWDGRSATGLAAPSGTYYYMINAIGFDGKKYVEKGSLTLIR
ncbi:MAG: PKD-like domain-containing protein [Bacteroidia bacterium]